MKKVLSIILVCLVTFTVFASNPVSSMTADEAKVFFQNALAQLRAEKAQEEIKAQEQAAMESAKNLESAKAYLKVMFDKSSRSNPETRTPSDYEVLDVVAIKGVEYPVTWSTDTDLVKAVPGENHTVLIDVDEAAPEETHYILTATITDPATGETVTLDIKHVLPEGQKDPSMEDIVLAAYKLADSEVMNNAVTLTGTIVAIPTVYSEKYGNITVNIQVGAMADNIIQCYRLSGDGVATLAVGDEITVNGKIKNYKGTIEFDKPVLVGMGYVPDQKAVVDAAYLLAAGEAMTETQVLVGVITGIPSAYSEKHGNITVDMIPVGDERTVQCYRLAGEGADKLAVGDTIVVQGKIKNYKGTIEFDSGCIILKDAKAFAYLKTLKAAYALEENAALEGARVLKGVITEIPSAYSEQYGNITVNMVVNGLEDMVVQCYRLTGDGVATLAIGDEITVGGNIKNYKGTVEFDKGCTLM